jgi:hypothetical protein
MFFASSRWLLKSLSEDEEDSGYHAIPQALTDRENPEPLS